MSNAPLDTRSAARYREASINAARVRARRAEERADHAAEKADVARARAGSSPTPSERLRHLQEVARMERAIELQRDAARLHWLHVADESARQHTGPEVDEQTS